MRRLSRRLREEKGVALVEFALVAPILLAVIFGIFYFGLFMNYSIDLTHMASEAARYAAVNNDPSGSLTLQNYIQQQAPGELQSGGTDVPTAAAVYLYYPTGSTGAVGTEVRACVTATVHFIPFLGLGNQTITASATMRVEQTASAWTKNTPPSQCPTS